MKTNNFTIQDIEDLFFKNGAGTSTSSSIKKHEYQDLIPNNESFNKLEQLGRGGQGSVYKIQIKNYDYAIKIMTQTRGVQQQDLINGFYNECKALLSVNDDRVLRLIGYALDTTKEGEYCLCYYMNLQKKGSLYDILKQKKLFTDFQKGSKQRFYLKLKLLSQIAQGLHAIHIAGLIHRDIKSLNILLDENDAPKIADLGLASIVSAQTTFHQRGTIP